jgi:hypothetical protein
MADKMELQERFLGLDNLQLIRRGGTQQLEALAGGPQPKKLDPGALKVLETIDWEPVFRTVNQWYDRVVAAMQIKNRGQREQELDRISQDVKELSNKAASPTDAVAAILGAQDARTTAGKKIGEVLIGLLLPAFTKVQQAADRTEQVHRNLELAFALAAYQRDEGRYPANLNALAPKYLAAIPDDLFSGKALIYRPSGNGYLLYSVGVNGRDEGGRDADDNPPGDDLAVRMPLPALKHGAGSRKN